MKSNPPATSQASVRPPVASRPDRKHNILLAAEKLFAKYGYSAVAVRDIAEEAQVPSALVGYYYGQKHELYRAIFEHWSPSIQERLAGLREAMAAPKSKQLERLVEAFVAPVIRLRNSTEGEYYALLATRGLALQDDVEDEIIREFFDPLAHKYIAALHATLERQHPGLTKAQVAWCYQFALGALMHHISDQRVYRLSLGENKPGDPAVQPPLMKFIVEGIRAAAKEFLRR